MSGILVECFFVPGIVMAESVDEFLENEGVVLDSEVLRSINLYI